MKGTKILQKLFYCFMISVLLATAVMAETVECEDETSSGFGGIGVSGIGDTDQTNASGGKGFRLGPNWSDDPNYIHWGEGDYANYEINLQAYDNASIIVRYSDDIAGNIVRVLLDGVEKGRFMTSDTGYGWGNYVWTYPIPLGAISEDSHTIRFEIAENGGGGVGVLLDQFEIRGGGAIICGTVKECEDFNSFAFGGVGLSDGTGTVAEVNAFGGCGLRLGPNWHQDANGHWGEGDYAIYDVNLDAYNSALLRVRYSDDVAGNVIDVNVDGQIKGQFTTIDTGYQWGNFVWTEPIFLNNVSAGIHTIKLEIAENGGGGVGVFLDAIHVRDASVAEANAANFVAFLKSSINPSTGLVESREADHEDHTTVFKNGLAALAFLRAGDTDSAEGIFDFFKSVYEDGTDDFPGFEQDWNAETGQPMGANYWIGDGGFLLLALNYYKEVNGSYGDYRELVYAMVDWIAEEGNNWTKDLATEGAANCYAALAPFEGPENINNALIRLKGGFYETAEFVNYLDHIGRAALVFGDLDGFDYVSGHAKTETWGYDGTTQISAYRAGTPEDMNYINFEINAQVLNAWDMWSSDLTIDLSGLENELEKARISGFNNSYSCGLPYWAKEHIGFYYSATLPIIDPTAFMCYYYWSFNPFAPGEKCVPELSFDFCECEDYDSIILNGVEYTDGYEGLSGKGKASGGTGLHLDPDDANATSSGGDEAVYVLDLQAYGDAAIRIRYSDEVAGNVIKVYLDDAEKGQFTTVATTADDWNDFEWTEPIAIGLISEGEHSIKLEMATGGSFGTLLDVFKIESTMAPPSRVIGWGDDYYDAPIAPAGADFIDVKAKSLYNVGLREDGTLAAWGCNPNDECNVPDGNDYIAIGAGPGTGYAIKKDGSLVAWGSSYAGQCNVPEGNDFIAVDGLVQAGIALRSDGSLVAWGGTNYYGQRDVPDSNDFIAIAAGYDYGLALRCDGSLATWGRDTSGQRNTPDGNDFVAISAGDCHGLALRKNGSIAAWGNNGYGQLNVPDGNDFVAISAGHYHSIAMRADGTAVAWGVNNYNQLNARKGVHYTAIAAGARHCTALVDNGPSGTIEAWGCNVHGECNVPSGNDFVVVNGGHGFGHSAGIRSDGTLAVWGDNTYDQCNTPSGNDFVDVATGAYHTVALKSDGSLAAWGDDYYMFGLTTPLSGNNYTSIDSGAWFNVVLRDDGSLDAWGHNYYHQCEVPDGNDYVDISAGACHTIALKADGSLDAWGYNAMGECNVPDGNDFVAIEAGGYFNLAMKRDGTTVAWGRNGYGNLDVPSPNDFAQVSGGSGNGFAIALNHDTSLTVWGNYNIWGQISDAPSSCGFIDISAGGYHGLALKAVPELLVSYEPEEAVTFIPGFTGSSLDVTAVQGGVNGAPEATEGDYVLKLDWTDANMVQVAHAGLDNFSLKGKRFILVDIYLTNQLPATTNIGLWNSFFDWLEVETVPTQANEWFTLVIDASDRNDTRITGAEHLVFKIEEMVSLIDGTVYLDNIRIIK